MNVSAPSEGRRGDVFVVGLALMVAIGLVMTLFRARPRPPVRTTPGNAAGTSQGENSLVEPGRMGPVGDFEVQFADDLASSQRFEASLVWRELIAVTLVIAVIVIRQLWFI